MSDLLRSIYKFIYLVVYIDSHRLAAER